MPRRVYVYVFFLVGLAAVLTAVLAQVAPDPTREEWVAVFVFGVLGMIVQRLHYQTDRRTVGSVGFLPFLSAGAAAPNIASLAMVVGVVAIVELLEARAPIKRLFNVANQSVSFALGLLVYHWAGGESLLGSVSGQAIPFAAFYATAKLMNRVMASIVLTLAGGRSWHRELAAQVNGSLVFDMLMMPLAYLVPVAYTRFGPAWAAILILPLLAVRAIYKTNADLITVNEEMLELMVAAIEARDPYTSGHSQRVAKYASAIATAAGLSEKQVDRVEKAALLHDVGKIYEEFAPILRKPDRLTAEEMLIMMTHAEKGAALVAKVSSFKDLVAPVRGHHEHVNGQGYPDGLAGDTIPYAARIIHIADTIDAMTTDRPYRGALTAADVLAELQRKRGEHFDPALVDVLTTATVWPRLAATIAQAQATIVTPRVGYARTPALPQR